MKGNTLAEFIDDLLMSGGPEKEFVFRNKYYFLETEDDEEKGMLKFYLDEYDNTDSKDKKYIQTHNFWGHNFRECVNNFEKAAIFDGLTIYQAEQEIEVLFG